MIHIVKIYLVTNCYNDPNKVYIGKTINSRKSNHKRKFGNQITYDYIDEISGADVKDWVSLETYWIHQFKQWGFDVLNKNEGGGGPEAHSEETKQKIKKAQTGNKYSLGKKWTEEHKLNMSLSKKGKPKPEDFSGKMSKIKLAQNIKISEETKKKISESKKGNKYNLGKVRSEETKQKIGKSMVGKNVGKVRSEETKQHLSKLFTGIKRSKETKQKMSKIATGVPKPKVQKAVLQYDLKNNFIQEWSGIRFAGESLGIAWSNISACCRGIFKTSGGFIWKFK